MVYIILNVDSGQIGDVVYVDRANAEAAATGRNVVVERELEVVDVPAPAPADPVV